MSISHQKISCRVRNELEKCKDIKFNGKQMSRGLSDTTPDGVRKRSPIVVALKDGCEKQVLGKL